MNVFIILTMMRPDGMGASISRSVTAAPDMTQSKLYDWALAQLPAGFGKNEAWTLFWSAEPDALQNVSTADGRGPDRQGL
jgi:hypothetical protein